MNGNIYKLFAICSLLIFIVGCSEKKEVSQNIPTKYPEQVKRWNDAEINKKDLLRLDKEIVRFNQNKDRYIKIEKMRENGVPAIIVSGLHYRESSGNFSRHLHEGSPLTGRTKYVPKGRPLKGNPPFTFEQSAEDALYILKNMQGVNWKDCGATLQNIEAYNGLGYKLYHPETPSPYLWSATTIQKPGKYVADGKWSSTTFDSQLGVAAILKRAKERGIELSFEPKTKNKKNWWEIFTS